MTYGHEDIDYKEDGNPASGYIFNAAENVLWRRIRNLMHSQLQSMYLSRESLNCWSANSLITEFDNWQNQFPEELWRLDIERKYLRTYRGGTARFLNAMMNGRKRYQRRQFERDQEAYIGTKYVGTTVKADQIMFRCNTPQSGVVVQPDYTLRIVPYSDMYLTVLYGNSPSPKQIRAKAGEEYEITTTLTEMDDTAILIYCASRIQALNDLSACYIHDNDFSKASKLKTLIIGNTTTGYQNTFLTTLNMGNNTLLETLDVRNCPNLTGSINLSACSNLENLYAEGTSLSSVSFARNGKVKSAHFPATVSTLAFLNLNYLTDLVIAGYSNLETFVCEYSDVDALSILQNAISTLQTIRILGIDWQLANTSLLNTCLGMYSSLLSGDVYVSGQIRNQELLNYSTNWPDLVVDYNPSNVVTQYPVTYVNADDESTVLYMCYVDRGASAPDPYYDGLISKPTIESTAQYTFEFGTLSGGAYVEGSGWDEILSPVLSARTVTAIYTPTIRTYTVNWYSRIGLLLETQTGEYGSCLTYSGDTPTNTDEEGSYIFNHFTGWDKSTGYITEDLNVYAVWERAELPAIGTDLKDMTRGQIFAVCTAGRAANFFEDKDYFDMTLGYNPTFSNVSETTILENRFFDGTEYYDTNIKLFDEDSPSFTLAIDYEFLNTTSNGGTLVSCYEETGNEGFRLRYSTNPDIQWGDRNVNVGYQDNRNIVVIRHQKGSRTMFVYGFNMDNQTYNLSAVSAELVRTRSTESENILSFGAVSFGDGGHDYFAKGWIHWCKIWYDDLGDVIASKIASWPHNVVRMEFAGADRYRLAGSTSVRANGSFIANNLLPLNRRMNATNTNAGGWEACENRSFISTRLWYGLDYGWQSIIKKVKITASAGSQSSEILTSEDYLYLASQVEVVTSTTAPYVNEGETISFFTNNASRCKFNDLIIPENAVYTSTNTEPTQLSTYTPARGNIWIHTGSSSTGYYYIPATEKAKHTRIGYRAVSSSDNLSASDGGLWVRTMNWWLRSPNASNSTSFMGVGSYGSVGSYYGASSTCGVALGFSI